MAPPKSFKTCPVAVNTRTTRSQNKTTDLVNETNIHGKRKADENEEKPSKRPRPAFGNITNAVNGNENEGRKHGARIDAIVKPDITRPTLLRSISNVCDVGGGHKKKLSQNNVFTNPADQLNCNKPNQYGGKPPMVPLRAPKVMTRAAARAKAVQETAILPKPAINNDKKVTTRRISNEFEKTEDSLYLSAHEDFPSSKQRLSLNNSSKRSSLMSNAESVNSTMFTTVIDQDDQPIVPTVPPLGVIDFDQQSPNDPYEVSEYTMDIFNYLKERERFYVMQPYMDKQPHITKWMRMLVVDWMVEVQETFELNHETLYLAVKVLDSYLGQKVILKDNLQLLGAAALFIACKFDERIPPMIDDFLFICDGAYAQAELIAMEIDVFRTINYDLGFPLSYRFVRRYAKCAFISLPILTLARFILEYSLMDYTTITFSDSKMASAALFMALRMVGKPAWTPTLEYYSGYKLADFVDIVLALNNGLHRRQSDSVKHVRNKYSHKLFHEVAKVPLLLNEELLEGTELLSQHKRETVINFCQAI